MEMVSVSHIQTEGWFHRRDSDWKVEGNSIQSNCVSKVLTDFSLEAGNQRSSRSGSFINWFVSSSFMDPLVTLQIRIYVLKTHENFVQHDVL